jgi:hypothetical protein
VTRAAALPSQHEYVHLILAGDAFLGWSTLALAVATFILAAAALWQLKDAREERRVGKDSLDVAQATLRAQQRPELIAYQQSGQPEREVHFATQGSIQKRLGTVHVARDVQLDGTGLVSFEVLNIGAGGAEITGLRLMSIDRMADREPYYWQPDVSQRVAIAVAPGGFAPVDLVLFPRAPSWFFGSIDGGLKLWVEITYQDLGAVEHHVRWFELRPHNYEPFPWYVAQVLREPPVPWSNAPPGNPMTVTYP